MNQPVPQVSQPDVERVVERDVVAHAEYPGYMRATAASMALASDDRDAVIRADWQQYQDWLAGSPRGG